MNAASIQNGSLFSRGMIAVLVAQFFSALADNALLFAAIAMLKFMRAPDWQMPLLQEFFAIAFILLAPFVGPFADSWPSADYRGKVTLISKNGFNLKPSGFVLSIMELAVCTDSVRHEAHPTPAPYSLNWRKILTAKYNVAKDNPW